MPLRAFRSPLTGFNALVPKDRGISLAARDAPFGPDRRQRLDLYAPRRRGNGPLPMLLFLYGGSWASGVKEGYGFAGRALAAQGFLAAIPDYRLVPQVRYPAFLEDGAAALSWLIDRGPALGGDPERIALVGHSAGAYNAAMLALDPLWLGGARRRVRALVGLAGPYDFLPLSGPVTEAAFAGAGDLAATQPVNHASADSPPALLLHGGRDRTVNPRNSRALAARLAEAGAEARTKIYPRLGHVGILTAIALPFRGRAPVLADTAAFLREAVGR